MIARDDFLFVIGYSGGTAIVDAASRRRHAGVSTLELAARGLYKAAVSSAVYAGKAGELSSVLESYNAEAPHKVESVEHLKRLFGVFDVPAGITRVKKL